MIVCYQRVSTTEQSPEAQNGAIQDWCIQQGIKIDKYYVDHGISGKSTNRPQYLKLLEDIDSGLVTGVVVYSLDRLSRKATDAMTVLLDWMKRDVEFWAVNQPILQLGKKNPLRLTIVALFSEIAQIERESIIARVKAGLANAKAKGVKLGAPRKIDAKVRSKCKLLRRQGYSFSMIGSELNMSKSQAHRIYNEQESRSTNKNL